MKKLKSISVFTLISMVMLFLLIMPAFASGSDTCTVSSDGTQTCVASNPTDGSGEGSSPGSPGTGSEDPVTVIIEPTPSIPIDEKPGEEIPVGEVKPIGEAPDAVAPGDIIAPDPIDEKPDIAEDSIGNEEEIRYYATDIKNLEAASAMDFTGSTIGWVSSLTVLASFVGAAVYAYRSKKNHK